MLPYKRYPRINPGKNARTFVPMMRYIKPNIKDEMIKLGTGGMNNLSLSRGK
jgi:hypothetical protein